jgi:hypothetical protein
MPVIATEHHLLPLRATGSNSELWDLASQLLVHWWQ